MSADEQDRGNAVTGCASMLRTEALHPVTNPTGSARGPARRAVRIVASLALCLFARLAPAQQGPNAPARDEVEDNDAGTRGSTYLPVDHWMIDDALRLHDKGYLPTAFTGMLPWTRASLAHMLRLSRYLITTYPDADEEAAEIYGRLSRELAPELADDGGSAQTVESAYVRLRQLGGNPLNDSFHAGQTLINDYGRPYQPGTNGLAGFSARAHRGRAALYVRTEYQHAPAGVGYSTPVASYFASLDNVPLLPDFTTPYGRLPAQNRVRVVEAEASYLVGNHEIGFGKNDGWLGPARGGSFGMSNNAENFYTFQVNRVDPLYIPGLSRVTGPFRYSFQVGSLKQHSVPNSPWTHTEKISFKPTPDLEFGFTRVVIWGGKDHSPITLGTFFRSFFSLAGVQPDVKMSRLDPGARFSMFDGQWRMPFRENLFSVYFDSLVHDNVSPISRPDRAAFRSGLVVTRLPHARFMDLRAEGVYTDLTDVNSVNGGFLMVEYIQRQGLTNNGVIFSDQIGREGKGGQAWLTAHLAHGNSVQAEYRLQHVAKDFVPQGTTQHNFGVNAVWWVTRELEAKGSVHGEVWRAPFLATGRQHDASLTLQLTYYPKLKHF